MALKVASLCGYLCNVSIPWRKGAGGDHEAHDWIQALKGKNFNGYAQVPVCGRLHRLTNENASDAIQWFGEMATAYLTAKKITGPFVIIPVPNSSSLLDSTAKPRTRKLAKAIAEHLPNDSTLVLDCLRFKENQGSASSEGGPREAVKIYKNLVVLREDIAEFFENLEDEGDYRVLLVDDVTTSGGSFTSMCGKIEKGRS
jgi:predicted amidophosphoribosyltransferase